MDKDHFIEQVYEHQGIILNICRMYRDTKEDGEDLFQEVIYQLWKSYGSYEGRSKISTWIHRIALNTAMASYRKPTLKSSSLESVGYTITSTSSHDEDENTASLYAAIRLLDESDRALLSLYLNDMSYAEMGEVLGLNESNVGARLTRIRGKIKKILKT